MNNYVHHINNLCIHRNRNKKYSSHNNAIIDIHNHNNNNNKKNSHSKNHINSKNQNRNDDLSRAWEPGFGVPCCFVEHRSLDKTGTPEPPNP